GRSKTVLCFYHHVTGRMSRLDPPFELRMVPALDDHPTLCGLQLLFALAAKNELGNEMFIARSISCEAEAEILYVRLAITYGETRLENRGLGKTLPQEALQYLRL